MTNDLLHQLARHLASSNAEQRKHWAQRVVAESFPFESLLSLFHSDPKTSQRFMWFIGDLVRMNPEIVKPSMPLLFSLRDQMPFPGMDRSICVWLFWTRVPEAVCPEAIEQLYDYLGNKTASIAAKSFAAKALMGLIKDKRTSTARLAKTLKTQIPNTNQAFERRMRKMLLSL